MRPISWRCPTAEIVLAFALKCFAPAAVAGTQPPSYDFQWATITDPGNVAYGGGPNGQLAGRGGVDYAYRISKLEVTSAQWLEFINIFAPQAPNPGSFLRPDYSGITDAPGGAGSYMLKPDVPDAGMVGVYGITWREAAMYCNWLHNGKSTEWSAIQNGAYDVSTFGFHPKGGFTDQLTHSPDALFWIPTLDEWIKAAHYDPNRHGPGAPGWWTFPYASESAPVPGLPGVGQTSAGLVNPSGYASVLNIPLGAYSNMTSPWGLWDVSGGVREYTAETDLGPPHFDRIVKGAYAGATGFSLDAHLVYNLNYQSPFGAPYSGLRVASAIPAPSAVLLFMLFGYRPRRRYQ
jgi:formylglycine-generating enzyme required for sulfatase activity